MQNIGVVLSLLFIMTAVSGCASQPLGAPDLATVKSGFHHNPQQPINDNLLYLAMQGDIESQRFTADILARQFNPTKLRESIEWYKSSFDDGLGDLSSVGAIARIIANDSQLSSEHKPYLQNSLKMYRHNENLETVESTLEVFFHFPGLLPINKAKNLIRLYEMSCVENCKTNLYKGKIYEILEKKNEALAHYKAAVTIDARAVLTIYLLLDEIHRQKQFREFAANMYPKIDKLPIETVASIGTTLVTSLSLDAENITHDPQVDLWLDHAIKLGSNRAAKSKIEYMLNFSKFYSYEKAEELIGTIFSWSSEWGRYFRASSYTILDWNKLDPVEAHRLYLQLIDEGFWNAYIGLGKLYSMGALDEVDHSSAIDAYNKAAGKGLAEADYRIAAVYTWKKGICRDYVSAFAYASLAKENGEILAVNLLEELKKKLTDRDIRRAGWQLKRIKSRRTATNNDRQQQEKYSESISI